MPEQGRPGEAASFHTTTLDALVGWARKYSLFQYPFVTACCGMEFMATAASHYDIARFGAEAPRWSPRQADLLWVVGTISHKQAPALKRVYEQMCDPKWVISFGACACTGGFYQNYATLQGIDTVVPVDVYIPGCPPRPEAVLDALVMLQEMVGKEPREKVRDSLAQALAAKQAAAVAAGTTPAVSAGAASVAPGRTGSASVSVSASASASASGGPTRPAQAKG
jgi:NADH-quinone oxidoreductase subunit B